MIVAVRDDEPGPAASVLREMLGAAYPTYLNPAPLGDARRRPRSCATPSAPTSPAELVEACRQASGGNPSS